MDSRGKSNRPKLKVPYYPTNDSKGHYDLSTLNYKIVADYANITMFEVVDFDIFTYWFLLREAVIYQYSQTEDGQKYLNNCWRMEQTKCVGADELINFSKGGK